MRNPPGPYKHSGANDVNFSQSADSALLAKRRNFADGGEANKSVSDLKQLISDTGVDKPTKAALANQQSGTSSVTNRSDPNYGWESNTPRYDEHGMPMHRVMETPYGRIPYAKGGAVKKGGKK